MAEEKQKTVVTDIIGHFGLYQLSLTVLTFVRYLCVAMMTSTGPLIAPDVNFTCLLPPEKALIFNGSHESLFEACDVRLSTNESYHCEQWQFDTSTTGRTLTSEFSLVCDRKTLRSVFQGSVSAGVAISALVLGTFSDKYGRASTIRMCFVMSVLFGLLSVWAPTFSIYTIVRSLCTIGDLGLVMSLATIMVESIGAQHRGTACVSVYMGWSTGVMIMPWLVFYFLDFRHLMMFTVVCHIITLPWILTKKESARWLLVNGHFEAARQELTRICTWNSYFSNYNNKNQKVSHIVNTEKVADNDNQDNHNDSKRGMEHFDKLITRFVQSNQDERRSTNKLYRLLSSRSLFLTTVTLVWMSFNSEMLYMAFILINSEVGQSIFFNYAMGGLMELLATFLAAALLTWTGRRHSLLVNFATMSFLSCLLALTHQDLIVSAWILSLAKLSISTLTSLNYVVMTEAYPTDLRQTGAGMCTFLGSLGAVTAPFICNELADATSLSSVFWLFAALALSPIVLVVLFLRETKDVELPDTVDELD